MKKQRKSKLRNEREMEENTSEGNGTKIPHSRASIFTVHLALFIHLRDSQSFSLIKQL